MSSAIGSSEKEKMIFLLWDRQSDDLLNKINNGTYPDFEYTYLNRMVGIDFFEIDKHISDNGITDTILNALGRFGKFVNATRFISNKYDTIIAPSEELGILAILYLATSKKFRSTKLAIICHGHYINNKKFKLIAKLFRNHEKIYWMAISENLRRIFTDEFRVRNDRCFNIGYSVDLDFFRPTDRSPRVIASAGNSWRDYPTLIAAAAGMNTELCIAAASTWNNSPDEALREAVIPKNVKICPQENYVKLRELYASSYFVVVPLLDVNHAAGYAVIAEALAMGKAVISTRTRAVSDFVIEGRTGFLVAPGDVDGLRRCMRKLLDYPDLAEELGRNGRLMMEEHYHHHHLAQKIMTILR